MLQLFHRELLLHCDKKKHLEDIMSKLSLEDESTKPTGSKEEYKYYVKEIVHVLQGKGLGVTQMSEIVEELRQTIMERDRQFREQYQFSEGIPNWELFLAVVVQRAFEHRRKELKLTNFVFNEWVN